MAQDVYLKTILLFNSAHGTLFVNTLRIFEAAATRSFVRVNTLYESERR